MCAVSAAREMIRNACALCSCTVCGLLDNQRTWFLSVVQCCHVVMLALQFVVAVVVNSCRCLSYCSCSRSCFVIAVVDVSSYPVVVLLGMKLFVVYCRRCCLRC